MGIVDYLPENRVDLFQGNDLVRSGEVDTPVLTEVPVFKEDAQEEAEETFLWRAVTKSMLWVEERPCVIAGVAND